MFGDDFSVDAVEPDALKQNWMKSHELQDICMKALQEKSFKGLYLRLQFWINQIFKSLYTWKSSELKLSTTQLLNMKAIISFLIYWWDSVWELWDKNVVDSNSFDWMKQVRLTWNGQDPGCKVECGAWSSNQANEYLGSNIRVPITPQTNHFFVFASSALWEKSAVMVKCIPSILEASDIVKEFS